MVVLFSLVAVTSTSVRQLMSGFVTILALILLEQLTWPIMVSK